MAFLERARALNGAPGPPPPAPAAAARRERRPLLGSDAPRAANVGILAAEAYFPAVYVRRMRARLGAWAGGKGADPFYLRRLTRPTSRRTTAPPPASTRPAWGRKG